MTTAEQDSPALSTSPAGYGWPLFLVLISVLFRFGLSVQYELITVSDSPTYVSVARALENGKIVEDEGGRTPGYPLLLLASAQSVWEVQMVLGVLTCLLLYHCCLLLTGNAPLSFVVGLSQSLNLAQIFFEAVVASETLTTVLVTGTVTALIAAVDPGGTTRTFKGFALIAGVAAGAAAITRPQYVFLPGVVAFIVGVAPRGRASLSQPGAVRWAIVGLAPGLITVLAWSGFNYFRHDYFTLSTYMGINLTNHTIAFVESAPDRQRETVDTLMRYRDQKVHRTGRHAMAVWEALPELQATTGQSRPQISKQLASLSMRLILRHPLRYAQSVLHAWKDFWMVPILWAPDKLESASVRRALVGIWEMEKWLLRILNASFLVLVFLAVVRLPRRPRKAWDLQLTTVGAVILGSSLLQALVEYGENPRYAVTVQPLVVLVVAALAYRMIRLAASPPPDTVAR